MTWGEIASTMGFGKDDVTSIQYNGKGKGSNKKPPLKPPKKSSQDSENGSSVKDKDKKGTLPWKDRIKAFVTSMQGYEEKLGLDVYVKILEKNEVDPDQIKNMTEGKGMILYNDLATAHKELQEIEES